MALNQANKVVIVGSGSWGSTVAKIIGHNVSKYPLFDDKVRLYVHEEMHEGKKLSDIINNEHENPKYLPGQKLPSNVVAIPDIKQAVYGADIIIFVVRQQFLSVVCNSMKDVIHPNMIGISLIKSLYYNHEDNNDDHDSVKCASDVINDILGMKVSVLMGPNLASEIAKEKFSETSIGCSDRSLWELWRKLFENDYFKVRFRENEKSVELWGALKNVVASATGISDGLKYGENTKAALLRIGFQEIRQYIHEFNSNIDDDSLWDPCGFADLIATCYGGATRLVVERAISQKKSLRDSEEENFKGFTLEGPVNAKQVYLLLKAKKLEARYPLMTAVYEVFHENKDPEHLIATLKEKM